MKVKFDERTIVFMIGMGIWFGMLALWSWVAVFCFAIILGFFLDQAFKQQGQ